MKPAMMTHLTMVVKADASFGPFSEGAVFEGFSPREFREVSKNHARNA
jgi:hypothetical protein